MATGEVGAIRWVVAGLAGPWRETESCENDLTSASAGNRLTTSSREPSMVSVTILKGERELMPLPGG